MAASALRRGCKICLSKQPASTCHRLLQRPVTDIQTKRTSAAYLTTKPHPFFTIIPRFIQSRQMETSTTSGIPNRAVSVESNSALESQREIPTEDFSLLPQDPEITNKVNTAIKGENLGRLFAVIHIAGSQFKITTDDIIMVQGYFPPVIGERIRLEKVLLTGSKDFTLVGRPMLDRNLVRIEATVIEKTLSTPKVRFNYIRRKGHRKFKLRQIEQNMLLINNIEVSTVDQH